MVDGQLAAVVQGATCMWNTRTHQPSHTMHACTHHVSCTHARIRHHQVSLWCDVLTSVPRRVNKAWSTSLQLCRLPLPLVPVSGGNLMFAQSLATQAESCCKRSTQLSKTPTTRVASYTARHLAIHQTLLPRTWECRYNSLRMTTARTLLTLLE